MACLIGVGRERYGDEGAGPAVARILAAELADSVRVAECDGDPATILAVWKGCVHAVVVCATQSGAPAGTIRRVAAHAGPLGAPYPQGIVDAVELARARGRLPDRTIVYGIEGATFSAGAELSPASAAAAERVAVAIRRELETETG
ncbi:MAG TPA: hydrogenase maturation protease [Gaiellaceae bacterium]